MNVFNSLVALCHVRLRKFGSKVWIKIVWTLFIVSKDSDPKSCAPLQFQMQSRRNFRLKIRCKCMARNLESIEGIWCFVSCPGLPRILEEVTLHLDQQDCTKLNYVQKLNLQDIGCKKKGNKNFMKCDFVGPWLLDVAFKVTLWWMWIRKWICGCGHTKTRIQQTKVFKWSWDCIWFGNISQ